MGNSLTHRSSAALVIFGEVAATCIEEDLAGYGVEPVVLAEIDDLCQSLASALETQRQCQTRALAATEIVHEARRAYLDRLRSLVAALYARPQVTSAMLSKAGLDPRPTVRARPQVPLAPTGLIVQPRIEGTALVSWRDDNKRGVSYLVETRTHDGDWRLALVTTRRRAVVPNVVPGVQGWIRVTAASSMGQSTPSSPATVYVGIASSRLAA